jgi:hypothetical protein
MAVFAPLALFGEVLCSASTPALIDGPGLGIAFFLALHDIDLTRNAIPKASFFKLKLMKKLAQYSFRKIVMGKLCCVNCSLNLQKFVQQKSLKTL